MDGFGRKTTLRTRCRSEDNIRMVQVEVFWIVMPTARRHNSEDLDSNLHRRACQILETRLSESGPTPTALWTANDSHRRKSILYFLMYRTLNSTSLKRKCLCYHLDKSKDPTYRVTGTQPKYYPLVTAQCRFRSR